MQRINGYLNMGELKKLNKEIAPSLYAKSWYTDGENEYLFKLENNYIAYKELFYSHFMKRVGFPCVEVDLAMIGNKFGIMTKNYNLNHLQVYSVQKILDKYWDEIIRQINEEHKHFLIPTVYNAYEFNLKRLPNIIDVFLIENENVKNPNTENGCLLQFIAQVIGSNTDLRATNMEIIIEEEKAIFSPLFDFGGYGEISFYRKKIVPYRFQNQIIKEGEIVSPKETLKRFLKTANKQEIEIFREYLEKAREETTKINEIEQEIEEKIGIFLPDDITSYVRKKVKKNVNDITKKSYKN